MRKLLTNGGPCRDRTYDQLIKRDPAEGIGRAISTAYRRQPLSVFQIAARFAGVCYGVLEGFTHKEVPMRKAAVLIAALSMAGCMTCREHPIACAMGSALIVGSIAAVAADQGHHGMNDRQIAPSGPLCAPFCAVSAVK